MKQIVGIGANVFDTLIHVPSFPAEDTKLRSTGVMPCGGGPCATGLVAAAKLGGDCVWLGNLARDAGGRFLTEDFQRYGVSVRYIRTFPDCASFSSYILINSRNASRTVVFDRGNVPPLMLDKDMEAVIRAAGALLVDGNDLKAAIHGARIARESGVPVVYDAGGLYEGVEELLPLADVLIPSEEFALGHTGAETAEEAARRLAERYHPSVVVVTQGKRGGILLQNGRITSYPALPAQVVDTNGAGDVFHGAFAFGLVRGLTYEQCCIFSSAVSALKCTGVGARQSVPDYPTVIKYLKECGYHEF